MYIFKFQSVLHNLRSKNLLHTCETLLTIRWKESRIRPRGPEKLAVFLKTPESIPSESILSIRYVPFFGTQTGLPTYFNHLLHHQIHAASSSFSRLKFLQTALSHPAHIHSALCPNCPSRRSHEPWKSTPGSCRDCCNHRVLGLGFVNKNVV